MARITKLVTISLSPALFREAEKAAKKEQRTTSELFREALRQYVATRDSQVAKREEAKKRFFALVGEIWKFNKGVSAEVIEREVEEAVQAVRREKRKAKAPSR
ncbi:MAG: ribbon-helix-helix protein, CopG family [Nitrospiria bacterium]